MFDPSLILQWLPVLLQVVNAAGDIRNTIRTGGNVDTVVSKLIPQVVPILQVIGQSKFPKVTATLATAAAIDVVFDQDGTKWVQEGLNRLGASPQLDVDGDYGPATHKAVEAYQAKHGLKVDGWSGPKTSASIATELAKLPK